MASDATSLLIQFAVGVVPLGVAFFAYRSATDANKKTQITALAQAERAAEIERSKVDADAFARAKAIYEDALTQLEKQLDRVQVQFERLNEQLAKEQDFSNSLRNQVNTLQQQISTLERTVTTLRRQLIAAGIPPTFGVDTRTGPIPLPPPSTGDQQ